MFINTYNIVVIRITVSWSELLETSVNLGATGRRLRAPREVQSPPEVRDAAEDLRQVLRGYPREALNCCSRVLEAVNLQRVIRGCQEMLFIHETNIRDGLGADDVCVEPPGRNDAQIQRVISLTNGKLNPQCCHVYNTYVTTWQLCLSHVFVTFFIKLLAQTSRVSCSLQSSRTRMGPYSSSPWCSFYSAPSCTLRLNLSYHTKRSCKLYAELKPNEAVPMSNAMKKRRTRDDTRHCSDLGICMMP